MNPPSTVESEVRSLVDRETDAWNTQDPDELVSLFHPDTVWPWPPSASDHDPETWVMPLGRFNRDRWKAAWSSLFTDYELVHNKREIVRIHVSDEQDGAFAVVDVDTLWRHRGTGQFQHWIGRACKAYTRVGDRWYFIHQTGLLKYEGGA